jgi:hypothetical protein
MPPLYNENTGCVTIVTEIENSITGRARGNGPPPSGSGLAYEYEVVVDGEDCQLLGKPP